MINSSIKWSFTGVEVLCTKNTSRPRTFSPISIWISPSENRETSHLPTGTVRYSQTSFTSGLLEFPEKTTRSCSLSDMRGLLQRAAAKGLPARRRRRGRSRAARNLAVVLGEDGLLHPLAGLAVERMRDVLEAAVLAALRGHRHEQSRIAVDDLEVAHDEAAVERDRHVGLQPFLVHRKDPHLGNLHDATPL